MMVNSPTPLFDRATSRPSSAPTRIISFEKEILFFQVCSSQRKRDNDPPMTNTTTAPTASPTAAPIPVTINYSVYPLFLEADSVLISDGFVLLSSDDDYIGVIDIVFRMIY